MINEVNYKGINTKKLKAIFYENENPNAPIAFVCYPNDYKTIPNQTQIIVDMLKKFEFSILIFNFQNIDEKKNVKDDQFSDIIYSFNWIREYCVYPREIWCFFFFQACIPGERMIMRRPEIANYILYSPTVSTNLDFTKFSKKEKNFIAPPKTNGILFYDDKFNIGNIINNNPYSEKVNFNVYHIDDSTTISTKNQKYIENFIKEQLTIYVSKRDVANLKKDRRKRKRTKNFDEEKKIIKDPIQPLNFDGI